MDNDQLISLLHSEVKPALGCTEPAAIAFTVARARQLLEGSVTQVRVILSSNVYKNALAVCIPPVGDTGPGMAAALGLLCGKAEKGLRIFDGLSTGDFERARQFINFGTLQLQVAEESGLYIEANLKGPEGSASVTVKGGHTDVVKEVVNGVTVFKREVSTDSPFEKIDLKTFTLQDLINAVEAFPAEKIAFLLKGIEMNLQASDRGLQMRSGLGVGAALATLVKKGKLQNNLVSRVRVAVTGACDARMSGEDMMVMSTMGSGNQGIVATIPIAVVAAELQAQPDKVARALALSHLVVAYVKQHIGKLSPICGCAVAAGAGAAAAIAWMMGGQPGQVEGAMRNIIGNLSGMICDGAKSGCVFKLGTSGAESIIAAELALENVIISGNDGIISSSVEETMRNLAVLSLNGMTTTDRVILNIMLKKNAD